MQNKKSGQFIVLLGGDHCGKSSILNAIKHNPAWRVISKETIVANESTQLLQTIEQVFFDIIAKNHSDKYPAEFMLSGFQMILSCMIQQIESSTHNINVIVDSYYYKVIAKCILRNWTNNKIFALWRSFPQPDKVIFIDTSPYVMWQRCNNGKKLNPFEHYGRDGNIQEFCQFQLDLRNTMLSEITTLPVAHVDGNKDLDSVIYEVNALILAKPTIKPIKGTHSIHITHT